MKYAIELKNKQDINGNTKRVYIIQDGLCRHAVIKEPFGLEHSKEYSEVPKIIDLEVTPREFKQWSEIADRQALKAV